MNLDVDAVGEAQRFTRPLGDKWREQRALVKEGGHIAEDDPRLSAVGGDHHDDAPFTRGELVVRVFAIVPHRGTGLGEVCHVLTSYIQARTLVVNSRRLHGTREASSSEP